MGFGYGYASRRDMGGKRYNNDMVAHVWNSLSESRGQSNNGNVYFEGPALFSYGSHYLTGFIMPDGVALLNGRSYSVSTSGHQSDARSAVRNRATFTLADLTPLANLLRTMSRGKLSRDWKSRARAIIRENAEQLAAATRLEPGESRWRWDDEAGRSVETQGGETAGEYLTRVAGLPAASWPKLQREAAKAKAKREAANAKAQRESSLSKARQLADMTDSEFRRRMLAIRDPEHNRHGGILLGDAERRLERLGLELLRAVKLANAEGFSKRRLANLRRRRKETAERKAEATRVESILKKRVQLGSDIATVRTLAEQWRGADDLPADYWRLRNLEDGAAVLKRLSESAAFPFVTRRRLATQAERLAEVAPILQAEHAAKAEERRAEERRIREMELAEFKRDWLAGLVPLSGRSFDAESGGAALRIKGQRLETSHGAEVPLAQAIKAFRFIKLCRKAGRDWKANGEQIRVGHFAVDWIDSAGNMQAGCHRFTWPEIERAAVLAGVIDDAPSAEAISNRAA